MSSCIIMCTFIYVFLLLSFCNVLSLKLDSVISASPTNCTEKPTVNNLVGSDSICLENGFAPRFNCSVWCFDDSKDEEYAARIAALTNCNVTLFHNVKRDTISDLEIIMWPVHKMRREYNDTSKPPLSSDGTASLGTLLRANSMKHVDVLLMTISTEEWYVFQTNVGVEDMKSVNQAVLTVTPKSPKGIILQPDDQIRAYVRFMAKASLYPVWIQVEQRDGTLIRNLWEVRYKAVRTIRMTLVRGERFKKKSRSGGSYLPPLVGETEKEGRSSRKRTCTESKKKKITAVLSRSFDTIEQYEPLINRTRSIFSCQWSKDFDHVVFHDGGISKLQQAEIKEKVGNPYLLFHNISSLFSRRYTYPIGKSTALSDLHKCPAYVDEKKSAGYYVMCSFWYSDFLDTLCGQNYDYMLRIDDDNVLTTCNDPTLPPDVPFASPAITGMDFPWVIQGMNDFMRTLIRQPRSVELHLKWPKWTWDSPYTSVMWLNMKFLRESVQYNYIRYRIEQSKCIFSARWGDLPLWGATAQLMSINLNNTFVSASYDHGSLGHKIYPGKYVLVANRDF